MEWLPMVAMKIPRMRFQAALACGMLAVSLAAQESPAATAVPETEKEAPFTRQSIPEAGRFRRFFRPFRTERAALSPDGRHIAYSVREGEKLFVVVVDADEPEKIKTTVQVGDDDSSTPMLSAKQREKTPARINWMRWVTENRVVVETNRAFTQVVHGTSDWSTWSGAVMGFDADGGNARLLAGPDDVAENVMIVRDQRGVNSFSVARDGRAKFNRRVVMPDEPTPSAGADIIPDPFTQETRGLDTPAQDELHSVPAVQTFTIPRSLRVFDLDPNDADAVTLVATGSAREEGSHRIDLFSLDAMTGKLKQRTDNSVLNQREALLDRQGRVRLTISDTLLTSFPLTYQYRGPKGTGRDRSLERESGIAGFAVAPESYFGERAIPLGFDQDSNVLYYASNRGRDTFGIYSIDLAAKQPGKVAIENPTYDLIGAPDSGFSFGEALVFDRFDRKLAGIRYDKVMRSTAWLRPDLKGVQEHLEQRFPGRSVELLDWDQSVQRVMFRMEGPADSGAFYLLDTEKGAVVEFARRAPWIDAEETHPTLSFSYALEDGSKISGLITVPKKPLMKPIPLVVLCPRWPWERVHSEFSTEVQALAEMGLVVVQLNARGVWGFGLKHREAIKSGYDLVQVEDIASSVARLETAFQINPKRVALLGFGHGGYVALRTLQEHPDKFRCAIAIEAPVDLKAWLAEQYWTGDDVQPALTKAWLGDAERLKAAPLVRRPENIKRPILLLNYPGLDGAPRRGTYLSAKYLAQDVREHGGDAQLEDLPLDYMRGLPDARGEVFEHLEEFLNVHIYDFSVRLKDMKVVD